MPLLPDHSKKRHSKNTKFITQFYQQYQNMERIIKKYWILKQDPKLGPSIPDKPTFVYRRAPSIINKIAPSKVQKANTKKDVDNTLNSFCNIIAMYQCNGKLCSNLS